MNTDVSMANLLKSFCCCCCYCCPSCLLQLFLLLLFEITIEIFCYLFIGLKISLFSMPSSHDPVMRMFHCLFIVLKISLFSMPPVTNCLDINEIHRLKALSQGAILHATCNAILHLRDVSELVKTV